MAKKVELVFILNQDGDKELNKKRCKSECAYSLSGNVSFEEGKLIRDDGQEFDIVRMEGMTKIQNPDALRGLAINFSATLYDASALRVSAEWEVADLMVHEFNNTNVNRWKSICQEFGIWVEVYGDKAICYYNTESDAYQAWREKIAQIKKRIPVKASYRVRDVLKDIETAEKAKRTRHRAHGGWGSW